MFSSEGIQKRLKQQPFEPLRILMSSGEHYDIHHPDLVVVGKRHLFVGTASEDNPTIFDRSSLLSLMHITALESLPKSMPLGQNGPG
jgi:hypothetical protein